MLILILWQKGLERLMDAILIYVSAMILLSFIALGGFAWLAFLELRQWRQSSRSHSSD